MKVVMVNVNAMLHLLYKYIANIPLRLTDKEASSRCHGC